MRSPDSCLLRQPCPSFVTRLRGRKCSPGSRPSFSSASSTSGSREWSGASRICRKAGGSWRTTSRRDSWRRAAWRRRPLSWAGGREARAHRAGGRRHRRRAPRPAHHVEDRRSGPLVMPRTVRGRSEEHTSELQSRRDLVCRLLLEKKKKRRSYSIIDKTKKKKKTNK